MLPSDSLQNFTQPQSTTNAESAPDVEAEKKKLHKESMNSSLSSIVPENSSQEYMASYSRRRDEDISFFTRKRINEKRRMEREKYHKRLSEKIKEIEASEKYQFETQEKDDIGGEFSLFPCCKEVENPEELFEHIKKHHDKDATQCALCGKELSSKSSLDRHLLIHAKWQPYQCCHCNKQFSTNGNMHRHKKTHRVVTKAARLLKEDLAPSGEISSVKKIKRDLTQSKTEKDSSLNTDVRAFVNKRKMRCKPAINDHTTSKKSKMDDSSEGVESVEQMEHNECTESTTVKMQLPDLEPKTNISNQELKKDTSVITDLSFRSPSKQEFIATLGLKNACSFGKSQSKVIQSQSKVKSQPVLNLKHDISDDSDVRSLTEKYPELKKVYPDAKEIDFPSETDCEAMKTEKYANEDASDKELVIDFRKEQEDLADITSILSNMKFQQKAVPPIKVKEECPLVSNSCSDSVSNLDGYLFHESKEAGADTTSSAEASEESTSFVLKEEPQQRCEFVCSHCQKKFENKHSLQKHMVKHGKPKPFKCIECGAKLLNKPNAIRHVIKVHKMKRGVAKTMIDYNLESVPGNGTKTVCEWCGQDFTSNLILEHHKRALTGCRAKPFLCLLCNKSFSTKNNGRRHQAQYHKDKIENCIVPNNSLNSNPIESVESNQSCISSPASAATETSNNISDGNDSSSNCSDSNLFRESSLPSKELAAAQVLLNLSMHTSKKDDIEQHEREDDEEVQRETPIALKNVCNMDSSNDVILQDCPLDLTIRPMDLRKSFEKRLPPRKHASESFLNFHNIYTTPKKEWEHNLIFPGLVSENVCSAEAPLNLVKRDGFMLNTEAPPSFASCSTLNECKRLEDLSFQPLHDLPKNRSQNSSSPDDAKLQCDFCSISFANNSNKRRHEKKKHQLHVQETTSVHLTQEGPESKKSKSVLSEKTKEAIISKVSLKPTTGVVDYSTHGSSALNHHLGALSSETESGDLASVSSLINTANSPQLKKYLTTEGNCDMMPNQDLKADKDDEVEIAAPKPTCPKIGGKKVANKFLCQKCDKEFSCESSFKRHFVTHTKERNFRCSECNKTFTVKSNRDRHLKKIHNITFTQVGRRNLMAGRRPQKKSDSEVPSEEEAMDLDVKDLTLPKELLQSNKENQRLFMPS